MPRASTSRSQRGARATQSQPSQPNRDEGEQEDDMEPEPTQGTENDLLRKSRDLARLALFSEHRRIPLKREEISKKVLGSQNRHFNVVFDTAQNILRKAFGMELVELRSRAELDKTANSNANDDLDETRKATGIKKKVAAAGSRTYILRSVLDPVIIEHAALTDEVILEDEAEDAPDDDDDDSFGSRTYGSIISWSQADQLGCVGLLYVILTLILVSGRVMSDVELRTCIKQLRLPVTATIPNNRYSTHKPMSVDAYLTLLIRQGYLDRQRIGEPKGAGTKRGRPVVTQRDGGEDSGSWEWRWGNRAESEVGEISIAKFAAEFMIENSTGDDDAMDEDEDEGAVRKGKRKGKGKQRAENAEKKLEAMMKAIGRAAGGNLAELN